MVPSVHSHSGKY